MVCLTSISASRSTSPGGVRSSRNATKVQAPKKSTETTWTVRPSLQAGNTPDLSIKHFSTLWKLCGLVAEAMSLSLFFLFVASLPPTAPPILHYPLFHFPRVIFHLPRSYTILVSSFLSSLQVMATTIGQGWGEDIKWSLTSRLVRPTQPVLWIGWFKRLYDSYPPTQTQNAKLYYCLIKLTPPPRPIHLQPFSSKRKQSWGHFSSKSRLLFWQKHKTLLFFFCIWRHCWWCTSPLAIWKTKACIVCVWERVMQCLRLVSELREGIASLWSVSQAAHTDLCVLVAVVDSRSWYRRSQKISLFPVPSRPDPDPILILSNYFPFWLLWSVYPKNLNVSTEGMASNVEMLSIYKWFLCRQSFLILIPSLIFLDPIFLGWHLLI